MTQGLAVFLVFLGLGALSQKRLLRYLRFFQQENYLAKRFLEWLFRYRAFDTRGTVTAICSFVLAVLFPLPVILLGALSAWALIAVACKEEDPRRAGKIQLNMTQRAKRIYHLALLLLGLLMVLAALLSLRLAPCCAFKCYMLLSIAIIQSVPFCLIAANALLAPREKRIQQKFLSEAKSLLRSVDPYVIGITGSFGKTSVKAAAAEIINASLGPVFWPEKGINTIMGITRAIREGLKPYHRYAVVEMGAYKQGTISSLCEFTPPQAAIVTAVRYMHLERFGSEENIYSAKSELAQAVPDDGILVLNGDEPGPRRMAKEFPKKTTLLYGLKPEAGHLDVFASAIRFNFDGSSFVIHCGEQSFPAFTPLLGRAAVSNILAAFALGRVLGADPDLMVAAIRNLRPVDNRLELKRYGTVTHLRDAYNSNPEGFLAALEVLHSLPGKRKVLMTPGMVELGDVQHKENERLGRAAAEVCNVALIVGVTNRAALVSGLRAGGMPAEKILTFDSREPALTRLTEMTRDGDIVLIENDLPDLYEPYRSF